MSKSKRRSKPQTAATGGSAVLLAARLRSGAGKHIKKDTRAVAKRRAIHDHS